MLLISLVAVFHGSWALLHVQRNEIREFDVLDGWLLPHLPNYCIFRVVDICSGVFECRNWTERFLAGERSDKIRESLRNAGTVGLQ